MKTRMTEEQVLTRLAGCGGGTQVFLSYIAGRTNTAHRAVQERLRAEEEGINLRHYTGVLENLRVNKKGELNIVLWVNERDSVQADGSVTQGNYRAFNPNVGDLLSLEVIDPVRDEWFAL